jgi:predicted transposase YdaD
MLGLTDISLKQTRFYQEIAAEERQIGMQEGIEVGCLRGESQLVEKLLTKRFGLLPAWVREKITQANSEQLELWGERILDANSITDVFN